jgi:hypothetical protein
MADTWAYYSGCWADVYDDDHEEMQACEANPEPGSALGLCAEHEAQIKWLALGRYSLLGAWSG